MAVFYNKVEKVNPADRMAPKKWYAVLKTVSLKTEKEVAQLISDETTLNRKEAEMALDQFEKILLRLLLDGHSVQLGDWGSFHLTCNSTPQRHQRQGYSRQYHQPQHLFLARQGIEGSRAAGLVHSRRNNDGQQQAIGPHAYNRPGSVSRLPLAVGLPAIVSLQPCHSKAACS